MVCSVWINPSLENAGNASIQHIILIHFPNVSPSKAKKTHCFVCILQIPHISISQIHPEKSRNCGKSLGFHIPFDDTSLLLFSPSPAPLSCSCFCSCSPRLALAFASSPPTGCFISSTPGDMLRCIALHPLPLLRCIVLHPSLASHPSSVHWTNTLSPFLSCGFYSSFCIYLIP